jgi:hypothetical protein
MLKEAFEVAVFNSHIGRASLYYQLKMKRKRSLEELCDSFVLLSRGFSIRELKTICAN